MRYCLLLLSCFVSLGLMSDRLSAQPVVRQADGENWLAYDQSDVLVQPGSALDFSHLIPTGIAGQYGRAIINTQGMLVFSEQPDKAIRVMSCALPMFEFEPQDDAQVIAFAEEIQRAGYMAVRPHWLDLYLMIDAPADFVFNPKRIALFDLFTFELKKRGIYLILDVVSASTMYKSIDHPFNNPHRKTMNKLQMYYDSEYQQHWKQGARILLNHINPHTKVALKDEPQVLYIAARNEPGIGFQMNLALNNKEKNKVYIKGISNHFAQWLKERYRTVGELKIAWADAGEGISDFSDVSINSKQLPLLMDNDYQRYIVDTEQKTYAWMNTYLKNLGIRCPVIDYNNGMSVQCGVTRSVLPMIDMHAYHDHPKGWGVKALLHNNSLVGSSAAMAYRLSGTRQLGAPFGVSEWGNPYFNPYRHEAGLVMGAYGALQNWQMIMQHALPVELSSKQPPRFFRVARDPSLKAAERMATLLFAPNVVKPAKGVVGIKLDENIVGKLGWGRTLPSEITKLALVSQLGIQLPDTDRAKVSTDLILEPQRGATVITLPGAEVANDTEQNTAATGQAIALLRQRGVLGHTNKTDVSKGIYQSDTEELTIDAKRKFLSVNTPTCQGATLAEPGVVASLDHVTMTNEGVAVACLLASLDGQSIAQSQRMLLLVASNSSATDATFSEDGKQVLSFGKLPALIEAAKVKLVFKQAPKGNIQVWALRANGSRSVRCETSQQSHGPLSVTIDQAKLGENITPYFEILTDSAD
ncbi:MAG TPA: hypothetical protein DCM28_06580 [Phycisphaerales bacterium]|nr:hypothetical protein [Phycisphaerales bacterium]|tara:strand:+ start:3725 stop:5986 length:2262 start_codon:yes stop_codon:yes gene_type:complete